VLRRICGVFKYIYIYEKKVKVKNFFWEGGGGSWCVGEK
jgi:hypothetical protein